MLDTSNHLKLLIDKKTARQDLKLHLAYVNRTEVKTTDQKIYNFSIVRLGKRQRNMPSTPIDTVIIRAQQDFDVAGGGLNPIQVEITDDPIINILTKYKNVAYKITPLGLLFPASVTNDTGRVQITGTKINGAKKQF